MSHRFYEGTIYHKRVKPKEHSFKYKFFMIDINVKELDSLNTKLFSINSFNLFSFYSKDHFGKSSNFIENINKLIKRFHISSYENIRFITLPRILGFVFNPISVLVFEKDKKPSHMLAEVHNYNGGRIIYDVKLQETSKGVYKGECLKDMYVSPFFKRDGDYRFTLIYDSEKMSLNIELNEENEKMLNSSFTAKSMEFSKNNILKLFFRHTLLTVWVVTRTIYESIKLKLKGLKWNRPIQKDQIRRY